MIDNPPTIDAQLGQRLRAARTAAQLTLRQLAARLGWPYTTLANYEEGRRPLRTAQLIAIAAALGRSPAAFLVDLPEAAAVIERIDGVPAELHGSCGIVNRAPPR